jgi:hypothetical protein
MNSNQAPMTLSNRDDPRSYRGTSRAVGVLFLVGIGKATAG